MPASLTLPAYAKINWLLKILGRRPDGFHEIRTVLQTIDLKDELRIEVAAGEGISMEASGRAVPEGPENLVWKAAELLLSVSGRQARVSLVLEKRIPVGAGLGGGSSDAAATLTGLNALLGSPLSKGVLVGLAGRIGSDVPFFLAGGTVLAGGRGERLELLADVPATPLFLLYPEFPISARTAYQLGRWPPLDSVTMLTRNEVDNRIQRFRRRIERGVSARELAENDFDDPLFENYPEMIPARDHLSRAGCRTVLFCGSGSTLLGIPSTGRFQKVRQKVLAWERATVLEVQSLSRGEYQRRLGTAAMNWTDGEQVGGLE